MSLLQTHTLYTYRNALNTFKGQTYLHYGTFLLLADPLAAADFFGFEADGVIGPILDDRLKEKFLKP